jgi:hypothetical protein
VRECVTLEGAIALAIGEVLKNRGNGTLLRIGGQPDACGQVNQRLMAGGSYLWDHIGGAHVLPGRCLKKRDMPPRVKKYG